MRELVVLDFRRMLPAKSRAPIHATPTENAAGKPPSFSAAPDCGLLRQPDYLVDRFHQQLILRHSPANPYWWGIQRSLWGYHVHFNNVRY